MKTVNAGIICGNVNDKENQELKRAFEREKVECFLLTPGEIGIGVGLEKNFLHDKFAIDDIDGFIVRGIGLTLLNKSFYRFDVLYALEHRGHLLINSALSSERALDKTHASVILASKGIPTPKTLIAESPKQAMRAFDQLGGDIVFKPIYGSQGTGLFRITSKGFAERTIIEMFQLGHVFYVQEFHPSNPLTEIGVHNPFDVRLFVLDGEVIGSMIRESPDSSHWKTNIHAGATPRKFTPPEDVIDLGIRAASALNLKIAGIDLIFSKKTNSWIVIEVNCSPGWTGLSKACNINVPKKIVNYFIECLSNK
ncbi:MAG: ATP-grasp domain-containing protein [Promethearchaeota archaeon]